MQNGERVPPSSSWMRGWEPEYTGAHTAALAAVLEASPAAAAGCGPAAAGSLCCLSPYSLPAFGHRHQATNLTLTESVAVL